MDKVDKRRSLTPNAGMHNVTPPTHAMRRGGARQTVSDRVTFRSTTAGTAEDRQGWALNVSRGGIRAILDDEADIGKIELGQEYEIFVGDVDTATGRQGRIVWLQEEPDGFIVGIEYVGLSGTQRAALAADASGAVPSVSAQAPSAPPAADPNDDSESEESD